MKFNIKGSYFNGKYVLPPTSGPGSVETINNMFSPADEKIKLWECPFDYRHVEPVCESASKGFLAWSKTTLKERLNYLKKYHEIISSKKDELSIALSYETGRPLWETKKEVAITYERILFEITKFNEIQFSRKIPSTNQNISLKVNSRSIGTTLIIGPIINSFYLSNEYLISSLIAGNNIILKPSKYTSYSSQIIIDAFNLCNFPNGVINLIQGDTEISRRILREKSIKVINFCGCKDDGKDILDITNQDLNKIVSLQLQGKNFSIITEDIDIDSVIYPILYSSYLSSGQRYTNSSICLINKSIQEQFIDKFHSIAKRIIVDHPEDFKSEPFMGSLINKKNLDQYLLFIGMAKREGFEEIMRGKFLEKKHVGKYVSPSIHYSKNYDFKSHFLSSEILGPNCTFISYDNLENAVEIINQSEFGLVSSLFSNDIEKQNYFSNNIETGLVNINLPTTEISYELPYLGLKNSGNFRPTGSQSTRSSMVTQSLQQCENCNQDDFNKIGLMD